MKDGGSQIWMASFSDLLILLLTFFVLRLSMGSLEPALTEQVRALVGAENTVKIELSTPTVGSLTEALADSLAIALGEPLEVEPLTGERLFSGNIRVRNLSDSVLVSLGSGSFLGASNELTFQAAETVATIAKATRKDGFLLTISGYSTRPTRALRYHASEWELSSARALKVSRQMIDAGVEPQTIRTSSRGSEVSFWASDKKNEVSQKRQVEILIEKSGNFEHSTLEEETRRAAVSNAGEEGAS